MVEVEIGDIYLCLKDVRLKGSGEKVYTKGKYYRSEIRECITNDSGYKCHYWKDDCGPETEIFKQYFLKINSHKKKYWKLINDTNSTKR